MEGITHYVVDHTPSLFFKTFTYNNSAVIVPYLVQLMNDNPDIVLQDAFIVDKGIIVDQEIIDYQKR